MKDIFKDKTIGVICGGFGSERAVSLRSGENVYQALLAKGYRALKIDPAVTQISRDSMDIAFIALHGAYGEDGTVEALLSLLSIPYVGPSVEGAMITIDKSLTKAYLETHGYPTAGYELINSYTCDFETSLRFPVVVKPVKEGSSVGVKIVTNQAELDQACRELLAIYALLLVEEFIAGKEITVSTVFCAGKWQPLPILELDCKDDFYSYDAKYTQGCTDFILPARLSDSLTKECQEMAYSLHQELECHDFSRVDMIVDSHNQPFILEINTIPGLTDLSDLPASAKAAGLSFEELIELLLENMSFRYGLGQ